MTTKQVPYWKKWRGRNREKYNAYQRAYYHAHKETHQDSLRKTRRKVRAKALYVLGDQCVRCGFDDVRALQIDHINGGGREEAMRIGNIAICRRVIRGESGYQLLCANCNVIKMWENHERGFSKKEE